MGFGGFGRAFGFLPVPFAFAVATGRVPLVGTLGVSLGLARTTMVTIGLRRNERTKRANKGMHGARGRGSQTDKAKRLQRITGLVNEGSQRKRTGSPSLRAGWGRTRSNTFNAASCRYFGTAITVHLPPVTVPEGINNLAGRTHSASLSDNEKDAIAVLAGSG
jgi:hypothetical protein